MDTPTTIEEYIHHFDIPRQEILHKVHETIVKAAPKAEQRIRWGMPTYWQGENLVHFASGKHHIGFYPSPDAIVFFKKELKDYKTSKGAVQFPVNKPIPYKLIEKITLWRVKAVS